MTEEEFNRLSPEMQEAFRQQMMQAEMMRQNTEVGFGAMGNPYGQGGEGSAAQQAQGQEQAMPDASGGGGQEGLPPGVGNAIGKGLKAKFGGSGISGNASGAMMSSAAMPAATAFPTAAGSMAGSTAAAELAAGSGYLASGATPVAMSPVVSGGAAAGGGGGGGMLAAAGPWAALAAAIFLNEKQAKDKGRRDEDSSSRLVDQLSGAVLEQDADALGDKMGGPLGQATKVVGRLGNPEGLLKTMKKGLKPWEWF